MKIRLATEEDFDVILRLYVGARAFMKEHGNPAQWGDTYPPRELVLSDMEKKQLYVCVCDEMEQPVCEEKGIVGVFVYFYGSDPSYAAIDGAWKRQDKAYGVIHRITSLAGTKGVAGACVSWCKAQSGYLRIDTHRNNLPMQSFLNKNGFTFSGIVQVENGERMAYEWEKEE